MEIQLNNFSLIFNMPENIINNVRVCVTEFIELAEFFLIQSLYWYTSV